MPIKATLKRRSTAYPVAFLAVLAVSFVIVVAMGSDSSTVGGRVGGDFPAFYSAGSLVADGHVDRLYDPVAQSREQAVLLGGEDGYLAFVYAPHVALPYAPLSLLPYRIAYAVHTALMVTALVVAISMMRPMVAVVDQWFVLAVAAAFGFYPIFMAVGGGQNTALTILLLVVVWRSLRDGGDAKAGVAVAALMYRPQYALPLLGLLFLGRHLRAVGWALAGIAATWLVDAFLLGPTWVADWLHIVGPFVSKDADVNGHNAVSALGFMQSLFGSESTLAVLVGTVASLAVAAALASEWRRPAADLDHLMALTAIGLVLLSPHTMFYDAGLMVITLAVLVDRSPSPWWPLYAIVAALALLQAASVTLGSSPFAPVVAVVFAITLHRRDHTTFQPAMAAV